MAVTLQLAALLFDFILDRIIAQRVGEAFEIFSAVSGMSKL